MDSDSDADTGSRFFASPTPRRSLNSQPPLAQSRSRSTQKKRAPASQGPSSPLPAMHVAIRRQRSDEMHEYDDESRHFTSPQPRLRPISKPPSTQQRRSSQKKRKSTPQKPRSTPKRSRHWLTSSSPVESRPIRVELTRPPTSFQTYDTVNIRSCSAGRTFPVPKRSQRVKANWQFIVCVADDEHASVPRDQLTRDHARCFYCLSCNIELPIRKGKSIVAPHMKSVYPDELHAFQENEQIQKESEASRKLTNVFMKSGASEQSVFNAIVAQWVGTSLRPMSIVEDQGFLDAVRFANNAKTLLSIPSRQTVAEGVHAKASQYRLSLRLRLADDKECYFFSLSSDIWTSLKRESFISLTLHYVDASFDMHSWTLEVTEIPGKHDGDAIADVLVRCFSWWRLDPKRCVIFLRDGATNMIKACVTLGLRHMSCSAHSLHLVVGGALLIKCKERNSIAADKEDGAGNNDATICHDGNVPRLAEGTNSVPAFVDSSTGVAPGLRLQRLGWIDDQLEELERPDDTQDVDSQTEPFEWINDADIDDLCDSVATFVTTVETSSSAEISSDDMESVRKIVLQFRKLSTYFHHSQKGSNRLEKLQSDKKNPLEVMNDCPTRWNSTFTMLQRFVDLQGVLQKFFVFLETPVGKKEFDDVSLFFLPRSALLLISLALNHILL